MPHYGPWIQGPNVSITLASVIDRRHNVSVGDLVSNVGLATSISQALSGSHQLTTDDQGPVSYDPDVVAIWGQRNTGTGIAAFAEQVIFWTTRQFVDNQLNPVPPPFPFPTGAISYEYESYQGVFVPGTLELSGNLLTISESSTAVSSSAGTIYALTPAQYVVLIDGKPGLGSWRTTALGTAIASGPAPSAGGTDQTAADVTGLDFDANSFAVFYMTPDIQGTGGWSVGDKGNVQLRPPGAIPGSPGLPYITVTYVPPRYRFVYAQIPPLRQFPRDDPLVGAGPPRQSPSIGRSVQSTVRQGWNGTYR